MTYVTKRCPYCNYAFQFMKTGNQRQYGCPLKKCPKCQEYYFDSDVVEPALHGYKNSYETSQSIKLGITIALYFPIGLLMLSGGVGLLLYGEMIGIFCCLFGGFISYLILSVIKQGINDTKNHDKIIEQQQLDYDKSMERLKNTNYLAALARHDKLAKELLEERLSMETEHYADRPQ